MSPEAIHRRRLRRWKRRADRQGVTMHEYYLRRLMADLKHDDQFAEKRKLPSRR